MKNRFKVQSSGAGTDARADAFSALVALKFISYLGRHQVGVQDSEWVSRIPLLEWVSRIPLL